MGFFPRLRGRGAALPVAAARLRWVLLPRALLTSLGRGNLASRVAWRWTRGEAAGIGWSGTRRRAWRGWEALNAFGWRRTGGGCWLGRGNEGVCVCGGLVSFLSACGRGLACDLRCLAMPHRDDGVWLLGWRERERGVMATRLRCTMHRRAFTGRRCCAPWRWRGVESNRKLPKP